MESIHHFETQTVINNIDTAPSTPSSSSDYITGEAEDSSDSKAPVPCTLKSVENLLTLSKAMDQADLQEMISKCKQMVLESAECSEERKWLVRRLIELRLRAQELRETSNESIRETCVILGHHFAPQKYYIATSGSVYCDHCSAGIWTMLQSWYMCKDCGFCCHLKCMINICRVCAHVIASEAGGYTYTKAICPERGLSAQGYRCAECNSRITFISEFIILQAASKGLFLLCLGSPFKYTESGWIEPRLCDFSGLYYCQKCHWNSLAVIPARIIRNWDMEPKKVCRAAYQLLILLQNKPVLMLEELNQKLFTLIPDLSLIKRLREELQMMKQYLIICPEASSQGLPWKSRLRNHMLENTSNYSVKDLVDLQNGILMDEIQIVYNIMKTHITEICSYCRARAHLCEICGNNEKIYPWDTTATMCQTCSTVYHRLCRSKHNTCCPKCLRIQQRQIAHLKEVNCQKENANCNSNL